MTMQRATLKSSLPTRTPSDKYTPTQKSQLWITGFSVWSRMVDHVPTAPQLMSTGADRYVGWGLLKDALRPS